MIKIIYIFLLLTSAVWGQEEKPNMDSLWADTNWHVLKFTEFKTDSFEIYHNGKHRTFLSGDSVLIIDGEIYTQAEYRLLNNLFKAIPEPRRAKLVERVSMTDSVYVVISGNINTGDCFYYTTSTTTGLKWRR